MFRGFFSLFIPAFSGRNRKPKRRVQGAARVAGANFQPTDAAAGAGPRVLLADLAGDRGGAATGHVTNALSRCGCIEVFRANQVLKMSKAGNIVQQLVMAADKGRGWVEEQGADLPLDFNETFDPVLHAGVLAAIGPTFKGSRGRIAEFLAPALQGTKVFIQAPPDGFNEDRHATVLTTIGNAFAAHFRLGGGDKKLGNAGAAYKKALKKISSEQAPEIWAVAHSHYASVLKAQGDGKTDEATEALKNAAALGANRQQFGRRVFFPGQTQRRSGVAARSVVML
ncbi:MAG: hypothetical protein HOK25_08885 [Rhodospirillaceae bacterium]|nr:hypothetical protein [Rhodospirillaceae bacterium]